MYNCCLFKVLPDIKYLHLQSLQGASSWHPNFWDYVMVDLYLPIFRLTQCTNKMHHLVCLWVRASYWQWLNIPIVCVSVCLFYIHIFLVTQQKVFINWGNLFFKLDFQNCSYYESCEEKCTVPENIHTSPTERIGISWRGWGGEWGVP